MVRTKLLTMCVAAAMLALTGSVQADIMWASGSDVGVGADPEIFKLDTSTGEVVAGSKWSYNNPGPSTFGGVQWIQGIADSGDYLYAAARPTGTWGDYYKIMQLDRSTGNVLSETYVYGLYDDGTDEKVYRTHINALEYANGKLYGVDNTTTGSHPYRGNIIEMSLDITGEVTAASLGAYIGVAPDGALDLHDGTFYASSWKSGGDPGESWLATIGEADIGDDTKSFDKTLYTDPASGLMSGWQFDNNGDIISVSWQNNGLYNINPTTGATTKLSDITGLSPDLYMDGLEAVVPEPATLCLLGLGGLLLRRRKSVA